MSIVSDRSPIPHPLQPSTISPLGTFDPTCQPSEHLTVTQHTKAGIHNLVPHFHPAFTLQITHFDTSGNPFRHHIAIAAHLAFTPITPRTTKPRSGTRAQDPRSRTPIYNTPRPQHPRIFLVRVPCNICPVSDWPSTRFRNMRRHGHSG